MRFNGFCLPQRSRGGRFLALPLALLVAGCGHGTGSARQGGHGCSPSAMETCSLDSASAHIQALITLEQHAEAAELLALAMAVGLITGAAAQEMQAQIKQLQERKDRESPRRVPPPVGDGMSEQSRTCKTDYPGLPICFLLPEEYAYYGQHQALERMKARFGEKSLALHADAPAQDGPCKGSGRHFNVRLSGKRMGSITCCFCCAQSPAGPIKREKCRIVW